MTLVPSNLSTKIELSYRMSLNYNSGPRGRYTTLKLRYIYRYGAGTSYVYAKNSNGNKSVTRSISVETGCSFPGGHCLAVASEEETAKSNGTLPVSPYAAIWMPTTALLKQE